MCDKANLERWANGQFSRREFGAVTGAAALAACTPGETGGENSSSDASASASARASGSGNLPGDQVSFSTEDGMLDGRFFAAPDGPAPAVIHWPDIAGIRSSHAEMAARTAAAGYAVLLVNPYYRDASGQIWETFADFAGNGGWDIASGYREKLSSFAIRRDTQAIVNWLDAQDEVDSARGIGAEGYCMGGPFTVYSAAEVPLRVKAAASFHGGGLVREDEESPHRLMAGTQASFLIGIAQDDDAKAPGDKTALREAAEIAGKSAVIEVFAGDHGWTVPDSPTFAKEEAERAFADKLKLYEDAL